MTTVTAKLSPALAKGVARAADAIGLTHEELAEQAIRLFVRSIAPVQRRKARAVKRR